MVHGAKDQMTPISNARLLVGAIPDAELAIVEGAGHAYPLEQPERSRDLLVEWVRRRSPIAPGRPRDALTVSTEPLHAAVRAADRRAAGRPQPGCTRGRARARARPTSRYALRL